MKKKSISHSAPARPPARERLRSSLGEGGFSSLCVLTILLLCLAGACAILIPTQSALTFFRPEAWAKVSNRTMTSPVPAATLRVAPTPRPRPTPAPRPTPPAPYAEAWVARYAGPDNGQDEAFAIAVDGSGNVYVTGRSYVGPGPGPNYDYATIKYNSIGQQQWVARYNGPGDAYDEGRAIAVDTSGNVFVTGSSAGADGDSDYATIKYNATGQEQWVARYDGGGTTFGDSAVAIAIDASGNAYVTGLSDDGNGIAYGTIKYNPAGQEQWVARYSGPASGGGHATAMAIDSSDNIYVTGILGNASGSNYGTIKYNSVGEEQWVALYDGPGNNDIAKAIAVDAGGSLYVTGASEGPGAAAFDYATVKYNSVGQEQWAARYVGPSDHDEALAVATDKLGNVYVTGFSYDSGTNFDYATIKYNSAGQQQWVDRYDG
jgi:uncharacterized delta-60 repeat protein